MKTMRKLTERFNRNNPDYRACFHPEWSVRGYYVLWITELASGLCGRVTFSTCNEFRNWIDNVVID